MPDVQMAIRFWWKAGHDRFVLSGFQVTDYDISYEIGYRYQFVIAHCFRLC